MTVSTLTVVPEASASGTAPCAEPTRPALSMMDPAEQIAARMGRADFDAWIAALCDVEPSPEAKPS